MAKVISLPNRHDCIAEIEREITFVDDRGSKWPIGTIVECSCGTRYELAEHQWEGAFWRLPREPLIR